jgi:molecular chaperone GrpE
MDNDQPADASPAESEPAKDPKAADLTVEEQLAEAKEHADKYQQNWTRAAADLQNYKRRAEQERDETRRFASSALIINLLPVLDDFERAFATLDSRMRRNMTWFDGIEMIYRKLGALLDNAGVKPIQADGQKFDPNLHEAVQHVEGEEDGKVVAEVQRGYTLHDRVLRPAMVVVGSGKKDEEKKEEGSDEDVASGEPANGDSN